MPTKTKSADNERIPPQRVNSSNSVKSNNSNKRKRGAKSKKSSEADDGSPKDLTFLGDHFMPGKLDVICSRGKHAYNHSGNCWLRSMVEEQMDAYANARSKSDKSLVVSVLVGRVQQANPQGGFVREQGGKWYRVTDRYAREKVGQQFRDLLHTKYKSSTRAKAERKKQQETIAEPSLVSANDQSSLESNSYRSTISERQPGKRNAEDDVAAKLSHIPTPKPRARPIPMKAAPSKPPASMPINYDRQLLAAGHRSLPNMRYVNDGFNNHSFTSLTGSDGYPRGLAPSRPFAAANAGMFPQGIRAPQFNGAHGMYPPMVPPMVAPSQSSSGVYPPGLAPPPPPPFSSPQRSLASVLSSPASARANRRRSIGKKVEDGDTSNLDFDLGDLEPLAADTPQMAFQFSSSSMLEEQFPGLFPAPASAPAILDDANDLDGMPPLKFSDDEGGSSRHSRSSRIQKHREEHKHHLQQHYENNPRLSASCSAMYITPSKSKSNSYRRSQSTGGKAISKSYSRGQSQNQKRDGNNDDELPLSFTI